MACVSSFVQLRDPRENRRAIQTLLVFHSAKRTESFAIPLVKTWHKVDRSFQSRFPTGAEAKIRLSPRMAKVFLALLGFFLLNVWSIEAQFEGKNNVMSC